MSLNPCNIFIALHDLQAELAQCVIYFSQQFHTNIKSRTSLQVIEPVAHIHEAKIDND